MRIKIKGEKKLLKNKKIYSVFALILMLSTTIFIAFTPTVNAVRYFDTYAYIIATPNPIGVGQNALVTYRVDQPASGATVDSGHFTGSSMTITKPDGTTEIKSDLVQDSTSSGWITYTPNQVGTYTFQYHFPGQWANGSSFFTGPYNDYFKADDSELISLEVQEDPIPDYSRSPPLPTEPWTRPIYAENKGWWQAGDHWLMPAYDQMSRSFAGSATTAPYTSGPKSPHVLWLKSIIPGGIVGGPLGDRNFYTGISYEQHFTPLVIQGMLFYSEHALTTTTTLGTRFLDLYTGEDYPMMYMKDTAISFAQILEIDNPNEHGAIPYLVISTGGNWEFYDILPNMQQQPVLQFTIEGVSALVNNNAIDIGPNGELLSWTMGGNATHRWIAMFNSTRAVTGPYYPGFQSWGPSGTYNASRSSGIYESMSHSPLMGIEYNVTVPDIPDVTQVIGASFAQAGTGRVDYEEGYLLAGTIDSSNFPLVYTDVGYDIGQILGLRSSDGVYPTSISHLWVADRTMINDIHNRYTTHIQDGAYARFDEGEEVMYCFDMQTGQLRWQSEPFNNAWGIFTRDYDIADGLVISTGFDGYVRAWNVTTGVMEWDFYKGSSGFENAYGSYPEYAGFTIADNTVYTTADEHSADSVLWRGAQLWAIDTATGDLNWKINGMYRHPIVVDGILVALNSYDGQAYAFGKGPSKTTISAPQTQVNLGEKVMITGTVTDQTPASKDTPAISDESMGLWMEYLHQQKEYPADATGVAISIDVIDSNGNYRNIGEVTSDASGFFDLWWEPEISGKYTIIATFAGSNSYGSSYAQTSMGVVEAPQPTPSPTPTPAPQTDTYIAGSTIAIIAAIGVVAFLLLRKK